MCGWSGSGPPHLQHAFSLLSPFALALFSLLLGWTTWNVTIYSAQEFQYHSTDERNVESMIEDKYERIMIDGHIFR